MGGYIHTTIGTLGKLFTDFDSTKLSVYDTTYDSIDMTFVNVHLILVYDKGLLLIRAYRDDGPARVPSTILKVPDYMNKINVITHKADFDDIIQWNVVNAICELRDDFNGYFAALQHGPVKMISALASLYGIKTKSSVFYATVGKLEPTDIAAKIYCCVKVDDVDWKGASSSKLVYVPYTMIKNYLTNRQSKFYTDIYRKEMGDLCPIYSDYDDRVAYPETLVEGYDLYRSKTKFKNVL